jgi:hypothetical protein
MDIRKIFILSFLILLMGCTSSRPKIGDGGFLSLNPCGPPCFYGMTPGITTDKQVQQVITKLSNIFSNCNELNLTSSGGGRALLCDGDITVGYNGDTVDGITFSPYTTVSIQQVIDYYGPPDFVDVLVVSLPDKPFRSKMTLLFDRPQALLGLSDQSGTQFVINANSKITIISYSTENGYQVYRNRILSQGKPWIGFGTYDSRVP